MDALSTVTMASMECKNDALAGNPYRFIAVLGSALRLNVHLATLQIARVFTTSVLLETTRRRPAPVDQVL